MLLLLLWSCWMPAPVPLLLSQGWPKFIQRMIQLTSDGAAINLLGPATATLPNGVVVSMSTEYPFEDDILITVAGNKCVDGRRQVFCYFVTDDWRRCCACWRWLLS